MSLRKEALYLRYIVINENGVSPDLNKLKCIRDYPKLKNIVKSFLGLLHYDYITLYYITITLL